MSDSMTLSDPMPLIRIGRQVDILEYLHVQDAMTRHIEAHINKGQNLDRKYILGRSENVSTLQFGLLIAYRSPENWLQRNEIESNGILKSDIGNSRLNQLTTCISIIHQSSFVRCNLTRC